MFDYEHVSTWIFRKFCDRILVPRAVSRRMTGLAPRVSWRTFEGFKEEIYLAGFRPDPSIRVSLGVREDEILAVVRPPSRTAHYHDRRSVPILESVMRRLVGIRGLRSVWLKRGQEDEPPVWVRDGENTLIPDRPVDGLSLLAAADMAISGGGTMNREAALLGTPAYSIFTGRPGAVDEDLIRRGLLHVVASPADVDRIPIERKKRTVGLTLDSDLCRFVVSQIEEVARQ
jgi:predicted glycosyltransferase